MDINKLYWAAGFLEGEGYFTCGGESRASPVITAAQVTTPETLNWLRDIFGGSVVGPYKSKKDHHSDAFRWQIFGANAVAVMMTLYSLVSEKRKREITDVINVWRTRPGNGAVWRARGYCKNGHPYAGANYIVDSNSGKGRCRQCGIESRKRYYDKHPDKWVEYARAGRARKKAKAQEDPQTQ